MPDHDTNAGPVAETPQSGMSDRPRIALICHADDPLNRQGLARWLASFGDLAGIVELHEPRQRMWRRIRREVRRVGLLRFVDVLAFRVYARLFQSARDRRWEQETLTDLRRQFPEVPASAPVFAAESPNTPAVEAFLRAQQPTLVIARCKTLLKERIFSIPARGTYVMHPGICPQYRNAHGCFWALAEDDLENVGLTLLRIDRGIDTGPVYGFYRCRFDPLIDSHHVIQHRAAFDNLPALREKLLEIAAGQATPLDTSDRPSREWGQPWLTRWLVVRRRAARRQQVSTSVASQSSGRPVPA